MKFIHTADIHLDRGLMGETAEVIVGPETAFNCMAFPCTSGMLSFVPVNGRRMAQHE